MRRLSNFSDEDRGRPSESLLCLAPGLLLLLCKSSSVLHAYFKPCPADSTPNSFNSRSSPLRIAECCPAIMITTEPQPSTTMTTCLNPSTWHRQRLCRPLHTSIRVPRPLSAPALHCYTATNPTPKSATVLESAQIPTSKSLLTFPNPTHTTSLESDRTSSIAYAGSHPDLFVHPPCSPATLIFCLSQYFNFVPNSSPCALAFNGYFYRWVHPPRCRTRLEATRPTPHHSHEGLPCRSLGLNCAQVWSEHRS